MHPCFYIDISKKPWVKEYNDSRLIEFNSSNQINWKGGNFKPVLVFSDFLPDDSVIPEKICEIIIKGIPVLLVLIKPPGKTDKCWALLNKGILDIIIWEGVDPLFNLIEAKEKRWRRVREILDSAVVKENLIGESRAWKSFLIDIIESSIYSHSNILIYGESGTGKELVSRLIHTLDEREDKGKLVLVDCTTVVPELAGSEFFGHEKGSYTSSAGSRDGAFALADKGTLFLDEISELPLTLQAELLRVIQEKTYKRVGSNTWKSTDFRLVCATNKDLRMLVAEGKFRQDLYYRISDVVIKVPCLRQHADDIAPLAKHFLKSFCEEEKIKTIPDFDTTVINFIMSRDYPGNIRELRQFIRKIAMRHTGGSYISLGCIPTEERLIQKTDSDFLKVVDGWEESIKRAIVSGESLMNIKNIAAYLAIKIAVELEKGDKQKAAERLNVTVRAVQQHFKKNYALN